MPSIPDTSNTTIAAIYAAIVKAESEPPRAHLGASVLGHECRRKIWYGWRWCVEADHSGRVLRLFRRGRLEEAQFVRDLVAAGVTVHDRDERGQQFQFSDVGGHVGGSMDAAGIGFPERPKTWCVVEFKTHGAKSFAALVKDGLEKSKPEHRAQCMLYMHWSGMKRAMYLAVNKDTDEIYVECVRYDKEAAERLIAKAHAIVTAPEPLERLSEKPEFFTCRMCDARRVCHERRLPPPTCRTCVHATPEMDGDARWSCAFHKRDVTVEEQRKGCQEHVYIPDLVPMVFRGGDEAGNYAEYEFQGRTIRNGSGDANVFSSAELYAAQDGGFEALTNEFAEYLRVNFGARIESSATVVEFDDDAALAELDAVLKA